MKHAMPIEMTAEDIQSAYADAGKEIDLDAAQAILDKLPHPILERFGNLYCERGMDAIPGIVRELLGI